MPQYWTSSVNPGAPWQTASGTPLVTAATSTISPEGAGGTGDDPQVFTWWQGMVIRVRARGVYTNGSTATNATFTVAASTVTPGTALSGGANLATTGALALPTSVTGFWWRLQAEIQVRAFAQGTATATMYTHGELFIQTATPSGVLVNMQVWPMPAVSGPTAANVDTTLAHTLGLVGTLSQATGSPSITCTSCVHEIVSG
jgi:hypothetical protein